MVADVEIDQNAIKQIQERLDAFSDTGGLMESIGRVMKTDVNMNFRRGVDPEGRKWAPLKIRKGQPLRDKGRLQSSYNYQATADEVVIGTNLKYAPTHHFGATIKPRNGKFLKFQGPKGPIFTKKVVIPARPALGLGPRQVDKINRAIDKWAEDK